MAEAGKKIIPRRIPNYGALRNINQNGIYRINSDDDFIKYISGKSIEELADDVQKSYEKESTDFKHDIEIAQNRLTTRVSRGKAIVKPDLTEEWVSFATQYSSNSTPFNYEIESILKYLVMFNEGIYSEDEITEMFAKEFSDLENPCNLFILFNVAKFSSRFITFYYQVLNLIHEEKQKQKNTNYQEQLDDLLSRGISNEYATPLIGVRIAKLIEDGHELADVMVFPNGNIEGVDGEENWIFMRVCETKDKEKYTVLYKANRKEILRYIIDKDNKVLVVNENGTYKTITTKKISIEPSSDLTIKTTNDQIEYLIACINAIGVSHDKTREITEEMLELCNPLNNETDTLKVEEVLNEELKELKKAHE